MIEPVSTHVQFVEESPPQRASIKWKKKSVDIPPDTLDVCHLKFILYCNYLRKPWFLVMIMSVTGQHQDLYLRTMTHNIETVEHKTSHNCPVNYTTYSNIKRQSRISCLLQSINIWNKFNKIYYREVYEPQRLTDHVANCLMLRSPENVTVRK